MGVADLGRRECFRPYAQFHHIALIGVGAVGAYTYLERCSFVLQQPVGGRLVGYVQRAGVEPYGLIMDVIDHYYPREVGCGQFAHRLRQFGVTPLAIIDNRHLQAVIRCEAQREVVLVVTVREQCHLAPFGSRLDQHVDSQVGDSQFAFSLRVSVVIGLSVEVWRGTLRYTRGIGYAQHLEVVVFVEPVACYRLGEPQGYIVLQRKDTVGRCSLAEQDRRTGIFDTADDGRSLGDEARTVAAERYGTQVVVEFLRVALTIEAEGRDSSVLYLRFVTRSEGVETVAGEERAGIDPRIVVLRGELVLELNMVEVLMMDIKAINGNRQIIADRIPRREGIHHPFIPRIGNADGRRLRHEMNGELRERTDRRTGSGSQFDRQILIVVHDAALHLHGFDDRYARFAEEGERRSRGKRLAVHEDDGAVGVRLRLYGEREILPFGGATVGIEVIVDERNTEHSRLVCRHIADRVLVKRDLRVLHRQRCVAQDEHTRFVPFRAHLSLVRTVTRTAFLEEDETAVFIVRGVGVYIAILRPAAYLLGEDTVRRRTIDADCGIAVGVRSNVEAYFTRYRLASAVVGPRDIGVDIEYRRHFGFPLCADSYAVDIDSGGIVSSLDAFSDQIHQRVV